MEKMLTFPATLNGKRLAAVLVLWIFLGAIFPLSARAQEPVMIGMGDSIGEGVQSADANLRTQSYSYLNFIAEQMGVHFPLPLIRSSPIGVIGDTTFRARVWPHISGLNLSVSGAAVHSLLYNGADAVREDEIDSETDLVLFPRLGSQMEVAESIGASLVICWIGNNDVLSAALSFEQLDASQMTEVEDFREDFQVIAERVRGLESIAVFANIPDVTNIGFLVDREDLIKFLGSDFGLKEGDYTSVVVMLLIRLGLDDGSLLKYPDFVLDAGEVKEIQERITLFNAIIDEEASAIGAPVVDINALFDDASKNPRRFLGIPVTPRFLGGVFSLDGVHPSNIGHAVAANEFIETINSHFTTDIPLISQGELDLIFLGDPFQDKDNDGRVSGRFGAGLLETLGPLLGISGDKNDFIPDPFWPRIDPRLGKQFIEQFLILHGKDPKMASEWDKWDAIEAFKEIFGLRAFQKSLTELLELDGLIVKEVDPLSIKPIKGE
jgi:hypothetical protein